MAGTRPSVRPVLSGLLLSSLAGCLPVAALRPAAPTGIAMFTRQPEYGPVKISPKGTYVAAVTSEDGKRSLAFFRLADRKLTFVLRPTSVSMVGDFYWVNDQRVVVELDQRDADSATPTSFGELYAVDANGRSGKLVFGYRAGEPQVGTHLRKGERDRAWGTVVDSLRNDGRRVLIDATEMDEGPDAISRLYKLDVYSGVKELVTVSPLEAAEFLTDENGEPRVAAGWDAALRPRVFYRDPAKHDWRELDSLKGTTAGSSPVGFAAASRLLYVVDPGPDGSEALYAVSVDTGERRLVSHNDTAGPTYVLFDPPTRQVVAVQYDADLPAYDFVAPEHPLGRVLQGLLAAFPGQHVAVESSSEDGKKLVVRVYSDRDPGEYMLVDVDELTAEWLLSARPWILRDTMSEMRAFHITASDGLLIHGYVTLPRGYAPERPPPMVVMPHGGPHSVRDYWGFDPIAQLFASQGFAVLQVNYRGSGGYTLAFQEAGYQKWGGRVQQDIIDATRFAVRRQFADPRRICSFGASFGAYSALEIAALAPDLFRCAVGYSGIYDLELLMDVGDARETRLGRAFIERVMGEDEAALERASPAAHADKIDARVLLIHGAKDERAPIEHAVRLKKALADRGRPVEWLVEPNEGHGFYDEGARERLYTRVVEFLKESTRPAP